ncbi:MAG: type III-B CRISPR-associated protein Cas10/Cmr2 [Acidobacteria bacterium]|nr:type III-B CRISPR-associated protein Cas10/Cmr2 [Acidobacteriota bacterium]
MTTWLLKFGLGGVQRLIGASRKTRDLASGSKLVAALALEALRSAEELGCDVLLPTSRLAGSHDHSMKYPSLSHQMVVRASGSQADVEKVGSEIEVGVRSKLAELAKWEAWHGKRGSTIGWPRAEAVYCRSQLERALPLYWVAIPEEGNYSDDYARVQELFACRKITRDFPQIEQLPEDRPGFSCGQCGERPAIAQPTEKQKKALDRAVTIFTGRDRLCPVCLFKRLFSSGLQFPSTHELALRRLYRSDWGQETIAALDKLKKDPDAPDRTAKGLLELSQEEVMTIFPEGKARDLLLDENRPVAGPYWAVVRWDGDSMGKWFSGTLFRPDVALRDGQKTLGDALGRFARGVSATARSHDATLVYAGGDDGLALCPLDSALEFSRRVGGLWSREMAGVKEMSSNSAGRSSPSLSLQITVAHLKMPLQVLLERSSVALGELKEDLDRRGGFGIEALIRAGGPASMSGGWDELRRVTSAVESCSNWRRDDYHGAGDGRPREDTLKQRQTTALPRRLLRTLETRSRAYFSGPQDGPGLEREAMLRDMKLSLGRSGTNNEQAGLVILDWLEERCTLTPAAYWAPGIAVPLQVVRFLARELSWN